MAKLIASVARDPLALGVVDLAEMPPGEASVKMLLIEPPGPATAAPRGTACRRLCLARPVSLWVSSQASQEAKDFADFLGSGDCAATLARHGLVPKVVPVKKAAEPVAGSAAGGKKR